MREQPSTAVYVEAALLFVIFALAAFSRLYLPGLTEFKADEARLLTLAWEMADFEQFPLRGISSSTGFPNFPASVWTYSLPLVFFKHVYAPTLFTGILNALAVVLCYFFTKRHFGRTTALITTLMFAVSPWAIVHSRKIWAQNLLPFFTMLWVITAANAFVHRRHTSAWLILNLLIAGFAFQIHLAAGSLLLATILLSLIFLPKINIQALITGFGVAFITAIPFILYLSTRERSGGGGLGGRLSDIEFSLSPLLHAARLTTGWQFHSLAGSTQFETFLNRVPLINIVYIFWGVLVIWGLIILVATLINQINTLFVELSPNSELHIPNDTESEGEDDDPPPVNSPLYRELRDQSTAEAQLAEQGIAPAVAERLTNVQAEDIATPPPPATQPPADQPFSLYQTAINDREAAIRILLLVWGLCAVFSFVFFPVSVELHYLLPLYPLTYIAAGLGIKQVQEALENGMGEENQTNRFAINAIYGLFIFIFGLSCFYQTVSWFTMQNLVADVTTPGGISDLLIHQLDTVGHIKAFVEDSGATEVLIAGEGNDPEEDQFAAIYRLHLRDLNHRYIDLRHSAVFPTERAVVVVDDVIRPLAGRYEAESTWEVFPSTRIGDPQPAVYLLNNLPEQAEIRFEPVFLLTNWVNISGYDQIDDNALYLHWKVGDQTDVNFHIFNHLVSSDGRLLGQTDGPAFDASQWETDDRVISRFILPSLAAEEEQATKLRTGMYVYPSQDPVLLLDEAGNPYGDAIEIPLN